MFLKDITWDIHLRLEKRLAIKDRFSDIALYRAHLGKLWAFQAAAEGQWGDLLPDVLDDFPARLKAPLLEADIAALGGAVSAVCPTVPRTTDSTAALGGFYVLEGATLGGQHLLPIVERRLGLSADHGASYLASYGADVMPMWWRFAAAVETQCATSLAREQAGAMARETFLALENWLCGDRQ